MEGERQTLVFTWLCCGSVSVYKEASPVLFSSLWCGVELVKVLLILLGGDISWVLVSC